MLLSFIQPQPQPHNYGQQQQLPPPPPPPPQQQQQQWVITMTMVATGQLIIQRWWELGWQQGHPEEEVEMHTPAFIFLDSSLIPTPCAYQHHHINMATTMMMGRVMVDELCPTTIPMVGRWGTSHPVFIFMYCLLTPAPAPWQPPPPQQHHCHTTVMDQPMNHPKWKINVTLVDFNFDSYVLIYLQIYIQRVPHKISE